MRDSKDLISVDVAIIRRVVVDLEMLEQVPRFRTIYESLLAECEDPAEATLRAVRDYTTHHVNTEEFPHHTPGTTGPGTISHVQVEVKANASSKT